MTIDEKARIGVPQMLTHDEFVRLIDTLPTPQPRAATAREGLALRLAGEVVSAGAEPPVAREGYRLDQRHEDGEGWRATNDRVSLEVHGATAMTHIDALSHFASRYAAESALDATSLRDGLVGRGVLIDVAGHLGRAVSPGEAVGPEMLSEVLEAQASRVEPGDAVWIRLREDADRDPGASLDATPMPGVSIACAETVASWSPSVVLTDAGMDPVPSEVEGMPVPWHVVLLTVLRIPLVDFADLTAVAGTARRLRRWEFLSVLAPLPLTGASGSPVNPLAVF